MWCVSYDWFLHIEIESICIYAQIVCICSIIYDDWVTLENAAMVYCSNFYEIKIVRKRTMERNLEKKLLNINNNLINSFSALL